MKCVLLAGMGDVKRSYIVPAVFVYCDTGKPLTENDAKFLMSRWDRELLVV